MGISWLHKIVHYVTWGQDLATCGCQVERSNFGCLGSSLVWITGRDAGVRPIVADQPKLEPLLATRRRGFRNNIPALRARHTCPPSCSWVLFANISNNSICSSEITFELFQKFRDFCGWQAKTRRNRFSMDFSVCSPRWLWQRLWEGEIIPTTDINLFLCLKTQHSTTQSICGNCKDNNSWRKKLDKLWTILSFLQRPLLLCPPHHHNIIWYCQSHNGPIWLSSDHFQLLCHCLRKELFT